MFNKVTETLSRSVRRLHNDEQGMESLQSVVLLALGAIVLIALKSVYDNNIEQPTTEKLDELIGQ